MNPKLEIAIDTKNRTISSITGMLTVGAKVDVEITGLPAVIPDWGADDKWAGKSVRFRIVDELGNDLVRFPHVEKTATADNDKWTVVGTSPNETYKTNNGTVTTPEVDFDTDKLRKAFCGVAFNDKLEFGVIIDSIVDKAEYAVGKVKIQQWAAASTDTPTVLPDWREIKAGLDNATAYVDKPVGSDTATIYITDTHGSTTTAEVKDGANGAQGATGPTGAKIVSQVKTGEDASGGYIYTQTFDDGTTATFTAPKGATGENGQNGVSASASVAQTASGATITCQTGSSPATTATVTNGVNGLNGSLTMVEDPDTHKWYKVYARSDDGGNRVLSVVQEDSAEEIAPKIVITETAPSTYETGTVYFITGS